MLGRWGKLVPDKEFDELAKKYMDKGYSPMGARSLAGKEYAAAGKERVEGSREYYKRFGAEGIDYRAARIVRTSTSAALNARQAEIAKNNPAVDNGKVEIVFEAGGRDDAWHCACKEFAEASKGGYKLGDDNYLHKENGEILTVTVGEYAGEPVGIPPYHPNCSCDLRPVLLSMDELADKIMNDDFDDGGGTNDEPGISVNPKERDFSYKAEYDVDVTGSEPAEKKTIVATDFASDKSPAKRIPREVDYSLVSIDKAVNLEYNYLQRRTKETGNEYMSIMTEDKKITGTWEGTSKNINSDDDMIKALENSATNTLSLLHTHTSNIGFSDVDIGTVCDFKSIKDIRAMSPDGTEYFLTIGNGKRPTREEVIAKANEEALKLLRLPRYANMRDNDVRWASLFRERNASLQKLYDWIMR